MPYLIYPKPRLDLEAASYTGWWCMRFTVLFSAKYDARSFGRFTIHVS
jgi:hypothetical protein